MNEFTQDFPIQPYLERAFDWFAAHFLTLNSAIEASALLGTLIGGLILGRIVRRLAVPAVNEIPMPFLADLARATLPILASCVLVVALFATAAILDIAGLNPASAIVFMKLFIAWIVVRLMVQFIRNRTAQNIFAVTIWGIAALSIFGVLDDVSATLAAQGLSLGTFKITALGVIKGLLALGAMIYASLAFVNFLDARLARTKLNSASRVLIGKILRIFLIASALLIAITTAGVDLSVLAVFSGAVGLGIGFGLQRGFANMFSGMMLLVDQSIKPGDIIEVLTPDGNGSTFGWVQHMGGRHTEIITRENKSYLIPNEFLISQQVVNWSHGDTLVRLDVKFGVHYESDPHAVKKIAEQAAQKPERVQPDKPPICHMIALGESSIDFSLRFWIRDAENGITNVKSDVLFAVWDALKENGIKIPYPHREIFIHQSQ